MPDRDIVEARELRNRVIEFVDRHERDYHGGEACRGNRIGILAYLAHALGIPSGEVLTLDDRDPGNLIIGGVALELAEALRGYERNHRRHIAGHNGSNPHA